jgi:uncharacterized protein YcbX
MHVSDLFIYPLKSARGIPLSASPVDAFGLPGDRRAMVVDPTGRAITQREAPTLAQITVEATAGQFRLSMAGKAGIVARPSEPARRLDVDIWKSIVSAAVADNGSNETLSAWIGRPAMLVFFDDQSRRIAEQSWVGNDTPVTFADGFQILVTTTGSLAALNANLVANDETPVGMDRFRPNIVVDCDEPWQEDLWAAIDIGGIRLDFVKPCARCIMTTQDQLTGSRDLANPMPAMGRLRMSADKRVPGPLFGWNAVPRGEGRISINDSVTIIEDRPAGWVFKRR